MCLYLYIFGHRCVNWQKLLHYPKELHLFFHTGLHFQKFYNSFFEVAPRTFKILLKQHGMLFIVI